MVGLTSVSLLFLGPATLPAVRVPFAVLSAPGYTTLVDDYSVFLRLKNKLSIQ